jgi:hypothetical protein
VSATVGEIKTALAAALGTITGLRAYDRQPDNLNAPFAFPSLETIEYHGAMSNGLVTQTYRISVIVGRAAERSAEDRLDTYLSYDQGGIRYAIESDPTLGGYARTSIVESAGSIQTIDGNDTTYLMIEFRVIVYA